MALATRGTLCEKEGAHRYFVAEKVLTHSPETRLYLFIVCTTCGDYKCICEKLVGSADATTTSDLHEIT